MRGYFYTLLITSVCGALCAILASGGFERYIKYIASLVCVAVMIAPLRNLNMSQELDKIQTEMAFPEENSESLLYKTAAEMTETNAEEYICEIVFNEFGIKPIGCNIKIDWEQEEAIIENITLTLNKTETDSAKIKDYLKTLLGGEVDIIETE